MRGAGTSETAATSARRWGCGIDRVALSFDALETAHLAIVLYDEKLRTVQRGGRVCFLLYTAGTSTAVSLYGFTWRT